MMTDISSETANTAGAGAENAGSTVDNQTANTSANAVDTGTVATPAPGTPGSTQAPVAAAAPPAYVPNFKYKAAGQEKEVDALFHSIIKDAESEAKVKDIFSKIDAFDFMKSKSANIEKEFGSLLGDYDSMAGTVDKFNKAVQANDLTSAFRTAGITKEQVFRWTQQQLKIMEMQPEQRQQYEEFEQTRQQKTDLEEQIQQLREQHQNQAVLARTMQLDMAIGRPDVASFAKAWDQSTGQEGSFREFVAEEGRKVFYEQNIDISPEQAVQRVMQRFGKFLNVGETAQAPSPQAIIQQQAQKPVIPHVQGKAAAPVKKVVKSLDDIKALAKSM